MRHEIASRVLRRLAPPPYRGRVDARSTARRDRQVIRILGIVRALSQGERLTLRQLQARFSASRETIYRDVKTIQAIGYPVMGDEAGRVFPLRLDPGFRGSAPTVPLTRQEVAALMWAVKQVGTHQPFRAALSTAVPKLHTLVAGREARFAMALDGAIGGWERGVKDYSASLPIILRLVEAIVSRRQCRVTHQNPWRDLPRVFPFNPYRLVTVHGGLYALGRGPEHRRLITLLVSRIQAIDIGAETFSIHPSYDSKRYEAEAFGIVWEKPMTVVVRFSADQAPFVREREWHPTQKLRDLRDGRVELTFRAGGQFEITRWILGWGEKAEVVRPARLRQEITAIWRRAATRRR